MLTGDILDLCPYLFPYSNFPVFPNFVVIDLINHEHVTAVPNNMNVIKSNLKFLLFLKVLK